MTADPAPDPAADPRAKTGPQPRRPPPPRDERFEQSMADLSRRMGERMAGRPVPDPLTALKQRQAALKAYDQARFRHLKVVLGSIAAVAASACVTWLVVIVAEPDKSAFFASASPDTTASTQPAPPPAAPVVVAAAPSPPASPPPSTPVPAASAIPPPDPEPAAVPPPSPPPSPPTSVASAQTAASTLAAVEQMTVVQPAASDPAPSEASLQRDEIREVQSRLRSFGFASGPVDGAAGPMTRDAALRYQRSRGQPQTGAVDRQLLAELREDPAPQVPPPRVRVAQRTAPPPVDQRSMSSSGASSASGGRSFDPFAPVKMAGAEITRFLQSLTR